MIVITLVLTDFLCFIITNEIPQRDVKGRQVWSMKRTFHIPAESDLRKFVLPEHVSSFSLQTKCTPFRLFKIIVV